MGSIWKGAVTFGLVNVPGRLHSATGGHDLQLHRVHDADGGRIRYQRVCEVCGKSIAHEHMKIFDEGGRAVILAHEDSVVDRRGGRTPDYEGWTVDDLRARARELGQSNCSRMRKSELIEALRRR